MTVPVKAYARGAFGKAMTYMPTPRVVSWLALRTTTDAAETSPYSSGAR
jgi:hypothetical protein